MSAERLIANLLRIANEDLRGARVLIQDGNRNASYLLEQGAEKVIRAILTAEGTRIERKDQHRLGVLIGQIKNGGLRSSVSGLDRLEAYATTFRYPTEAGRIIDAPTKNDLDALAMQVASALAKAAAEFGVDLSKPDAPARLKTPPR